MTCEFTSFSTVSQSYYDGGWMIMKGCVQWSTFMAEKISPQVGLKPRAAKSVSWTNMLLCVCLSLDTETVNYDHYLRLGGALNFEFSIKKKKKKKIYIYIYNWVGH